ncbi:DUF1579 domain-containing protein [Singulisphaera rosea]
MTMRMSFLSLCVVGAVVVGSFASAQDEPPIPTPTAEHKILAAEEGTWDGVVKCYPNGPESEPMVAKGVEIKSVVLGGLWVVSTFRTELGGATFEGRGQFGFDTTRKKYVGTWIDSMDTALCVLEGSYDAKTKTLSFKGDAVCPKDGSKLHQRMVTTIKDDGSREFNLYMTGTPTGGKEALVMQILYTQRWK